LEVRLNQDYSVSQCSLKTHEDGSVAPNVARESHRTNVGVLPSELLEDFKCLILRAVIGVDVFKLVGIFEWRNSHFDSGKMVKNVILLVVAWSYY
jgi:hypothetical protein